MKNLFHMVELLGIFGILGAVPFIAWTKWSLGAVLALVGTFFSPVRNQSTSNPHGGKLTAGIGDAHFQLTGTLRFLLVVCGGILLTSAAVDSKGPVLEEVARKSEQHSLKVNDDLFKPHTSLNMDNDPFKPHKPVDMDNDFFKRRTPPLSADNDRLKPDWPNQRPGNLDNILTKLKRTADSPTR